MGIGSPRYPDTLVAKIFQLLLEFTMRLDERLKLVLFESPSFPHTNTVPTGCRVPAERTAGKPILNPVAAPAFPRMHVDRCAQTREWQQSEIQLASREHFPSAYALERLAMHLWKTSVRHGKYALG